MVFHLDIVVKIRTDLVMCAGVVRVLFCEESTIASH